jgi:hypothetical protein
MEAAVNWLINRQSKGETGLDVLAQVSGITI